jgi:hypothetical protein
MPVFGEVGSEDRAGARFAVTNAMPFDVHFFTGPVHL